MKKIAILLFFAIVFTLGRNGIAYTTAYKPKTKQQTNSALTADDRKNYVVTITQDQMKKPVSASNDPAFPTKVVYLDCVLKVTNNSNDTLKYLNKSCAWADILKTDNIKMHIWKNSCSLDVTNVKIVAPHKSTTYAITVVYNKTKMSSNTPFNVGVGFSNL
ncbi:hypothetical protein PQ469_21990 [Mucilaginibacter sp. KACC 22773]|uniref:hypothetical protein n=1 Tax=Mucilaginibacter sp. KACC 22773 TaxID=3025671 RepID=UPI002365C7A2|nr:hypothetical protein [Mucilaginibacter sp. KACC 22773]WDF76562.1 hypothetical protein PQ469_21990 [Mucilaginibacter sp. KACC 22773]